MSIFGRVQRSFSEVTCAILLVHIFIRHMQVALVPGPAQKSQIHFENYVEIHFEIQKSRYPREIQKSNLKSEIQVKSSRFQNLACRDTPWRTLRIDLSIGIVSAKTSDRGTLGVASEAKPHDPNPRLP